MAATTTNVAIVWFLAEIKHSDITTKYCKLYYFDFNVHQFPRFSSKKLLRK